MGGAQMAQPNRYNTTEYELHGLVQKIILFSSGSVVGGQFARTNHERRYQNLPTPLPY